MGLLDDFLALPIGLKLLAGFAISTGMTFNIQLFETAIPKVFLIDISIGNALFIPINFLLGFFELQVDHGHFNILYGMVLLLFGIFWITKALNKR